MKLLKWITLGVLLMVSLGRARAQSNEVRLQVPFSFTVAGRELPAGEYTIERTPYLGVLLITGIGNGQTMAVTSSAGETEPLGGHPTATFGSIGGARYLEEVHMAGEPARIIRVRSSK